SNPGLDAFNKAVPLLKLFDPVLAPLHQASELPAAIAQLDRSLSSLIEEAQGVSNSLIRYALASRGQPEPGPEVRRAIDAFVELAHGGARGLIERGAEENQRANARSVVAGYHEMAAAAASVPALLAMKEYLEQTRLEPDGIERRLAPEI